MQKELIQDLPDLQIIAESQYTWHIKDYNAFESNKKRYESEIWEADGYKWRMLLFPFGNSVDNQLALFVEAIKPDDISEDDWYVCAQFGLAMWNPSHPEVHTRNSAFHRFNSDETDWGFNKFHEWRKLFQYDENLGGIIADGSSVNITAYVRVLKDPTGILWHNFEKYDSRKVTGYVGLKNQGATCYMNSLLQSLYFTNVFRKAVYQIPTEKDVPSDSVPLALQRLFYALLTEPDSVSTSELTRSFGWDSMESFMQHDVQEFNRVLQDHLERKMKGTAADGILTELFVGKMKSYIKCVDVDYESSRSEDFWDIQLNVKGCKDIRESFQTYIQEEIMDGENKYFAEGYGLQAAKKGVIFQSFPPVLHLQLKRFEYDFRRDVMVKINDRHEFPLEIDLTEFLAQDADQSQTCKYHLHGVLVHSGDLHAGHYYALLRPEIDGFWYRFDDDRVTRATLKEVFEENFGGDYGPEVNGTQGVRNPYTRQYSTKRSMSAYMLVYMREEARPKLLAPVVEEDIPAHLRLRIEEEKKTNERKKQELSERHLYMHVVVVTLYAFQSFNGFDLAPVELQDKEGVHVRRILKDTKLPDFKEELSNSLDLNPNHVRLWAMVNRQNKTVRPDGPLDEASDITMEQIREKHAAKSLDLRIWLEISDEIGLAETEPPSSFIPDPLKDTQSTDPNTPETLEHPPIEGALPLKQIVWPTASPTSNNMLIFLKVYDPARQVLQGATYTYVSRFDKVQELVTIINQFMQWSPDTQLNLYEEIKPSMIEPMKLKSTFQQSEIQNGDIICFERALTDAQILEITAHGGFATAVSYYEFLDNRVVITFKPRSPNQPVTKSFDLALHRLMNYDAIVSALGKALEIEPTYLRMWSSTPVSGKLRNPIRKTGTTTLQNIIQPSYYPAQSQIIYYEVLEMTLQEFEQKKPVRVTWLTDGVSKEVVLELLINKFGNIRNMVQAIIEKLNLDPNLADSIRLWDAKEGRINRIFPLDHHIITLPETGNIYAEIIPKDETNSSEEDFRCYVLHFHKEPNRAHGIPFLFFIRPVKYARLTTRR